MKNLQRGLGGNLEFLGTLILPLVSIVRGEIDFSTNLAGRKSAISVPDQPNYAIKKRPGTSARPLLCVLFFVK